MSVLKISKLSISINNLEMIKNASFSIEKGDILLLTGPNGSGKSTIIKGIMGDVFDYGASLNASASEVVFDDGEHLYDLKNSEKNREEFRKRVCYISQDDIFESENTLDCFLMSVDYLKLDNPCRYVLDFVMNHKIYDCFGIEANSLDSKSRKILKRAGLQGEEINEKYVKSAKYLSMNTKKMSGGQKKLTNIFSNLVKCEFSQLVFLDEPLNNLDYSNVRSFSNIITLLHREYPDVGMLIVTHCRSIPIVNRILEIDTGSKELKPGNEYRCNTCFGKTNEDGLYV